jgi:ankyrin repeat protein
MKLVVANYAPGQPECAELLIASGADVRRQNHEGETALHFAASYKVELVKLFLDAGADPNQRNSHRETSLHAAGGQFPRGGSLDGVRLLLHAGADPNVIDSHGWTPYDSAVWSKNPEIADELLKAMKGKEE